MKNNFLSAIGIVLGAVSLVLYLGLMAQVGDNANQEQVGSGSRFPSGISADGTKPSAGQVRGTTLLATGGLTVDTNTLLVDATNNYVGVASTTPSDLLSIGDASATSTVMGGNFCSYFEDEAGRGMWITLATSGNTVFATSTTACNQ